MRTHWQYWIALACLALVVIGGFPGCTKREPEVRTVEVKVAVPVPCNPKLPPRPDLLTKDQILVKVQGAATFDDRLKVVMEQLLLHLGWTPTLEGALEGCRAIPAQ